MKKELKIVSIVVLLILVLAFLFVRNASSFNSIFSLSKDYYELNFSESESCLVCHASTNGYSEYHNPELIGCASCHLGNTKTANKENAHENMVLIPGNLSDAEKTCGKCHPNELRKIENSIMTSNSGLVAVDKYIFGETDTPNGQYHIQLLENSAADKHLRDLCANCHLGMEKEAFGPITQLSRGGGCNACHLNYSEKAEEQLLSYISSSKKKLPTEHPSTDIFVRDAHCFGCHSRSSRISTNYMGFQETLLEQRDIEGKTGYKTFEDKRIYRHQQADIHFEKGLLCVDCHTSHEVMGTGEQFTHAEDAVTLSCTDCHFKETPTTIAYDSLDLESQLVFTHRNYSHHDKEILVVKKDGHPLVNTYVDSLGNAFLIGKKEGKLYTINPQGEVCLKDEVHDNVSCSSCHSSWTTRCIGCHNEYDAAAPRAFDLLDREYGVGQWKEYVSDFTAGLPTLGVREKDGEYHIEPAVPGMIMTIDKGSYSGKELGEDVSFHRLYAPNAPHTTTSSSRDCKSCHSNSEALGFGKGALVYVIENKKGTWIFEPEYELNPNDLLPQDAWIPFLGVPKSDQYGTRTDFRPFSIEEQKNMLTVGSCLECHTGNSQVMQRSLKVGIDKLIASKDKNCILPFTN